MSVNASTAAVSTAASTPSLEEKRVSLQALLLRKSLEAQQPAGVPTNESQDGRGQVIDLRV